MLEFTEGEEGGGGGGGGGSGGRGWGGGGGEGEEAGSQGQGRHTVIDHVRPPAGLLVKPDAVLEDESARNVRARQKEKVQCGPKFQSVTADLFSDGSEQYSLNHLESSQDRQHYAPSSHSALASNRCHILKYNSLFFSLLRCNSFYWPCLSF